MNKKTPILFFVLLFVSTVYADTYMDLTPGLSTQKDADRVLGKPIKEVIQDVSYDYSPDEHEARRLSLTFNQDTQVIETIKIYPIGTYTKKQLSEWFALGEPSKSIVDKDGNFIEYYGAKSVSLHYKGPSSDSPVAFFSHFDTAILEASLAENTSILKQTEKDFAYAWIKSAAERGFFLYRELRKLPTIERLKMIAEKAGRKEMVETYSDRLAEIDQNIEHTLKTYLDTFRELEKIDRKAIDTGVQKYNEFLKEHDAAEQLKVQETVKEHLFVYLKEKRADKEKWRRDLAGI
ncbi:MAG: hypothetical protein U9R66_06190 [Thermodesulfobacteriota bacterium]|nr:hypothetical protein [Thermodesulfobacteriota bacterium]